MPQLAFVNIPVTDLPRARAFYQGLGFTINEQFSDQSAACVVVSEHVYFMILTRPRFEGFAPRPVADPSQTCSAMTALSRDSREDVDAFVRAAIAHGGADNEKPQDHGFMYGQSVSDPDGNVIEAFWMDPAAVAGGNAGKDGASSG